MVMLANSFLVAGPPLITDDPGTPPQHGWEINIANIMAKSKDEFVVDVARFDINFGLSDNSQLKVEFPVRFVDCQDYGGNCGVGDLSLGWKYRFCNEADQGLMASFSPQLLTPTGKQLEEKIN